MTRLALLCVANLIFTITTTAIPTPDADDDVYPAVEYDKRDHKRIADVMQIVKRPETSHGTVTSVEKTRREEYVVLD
ncbi:hypothetical protein VNI00_009064 [Paramarasmius palmivorus]|uniref:Uncharacterized protein n=1 Tax=Paramarasmius palmivorus TaxID=297713 RepID=A0AAW0CSU3_9AGAR